MWDMEENPYQSPTPVPPAPDRYAARKALALCIKIVAVLLGVVTFPFAVETAVSIVWLLAPRADFLPWLMGIPISVAASAGVTWYGFRIANGILPRPVQTTNPEPHQLKLNEQ
jgi:hypothetical protein